MLRPPHPHLVRLLHSSARTCNLVGPPHPISHLRPVVYDDLPSSHPLRHRHPYSLKEFKGGPRDDELYWKLQRQDLDAFNHEFWADNNIRFEEAKQTVLESLPESSTPLDRERALSDFYRKWLIQETRRQSEYTDKWRRWNWVEISLATRVHYRRLKSRIARVVSFGDNT